MSESSLSTDVIADHLDVTKEPVYTWITERAIPAHKVGPLWKFQTAEADAWVRSDGGAICRDEAEE